MQNEASIVFDSRHASTARLAQPGLADAARIGELMPRAFAFLASPSDAGRSRYDIFVTEHFASIP
jgi:hypothetical protein